MKTDLDKNLSLLGMILITIIITFLLLDVKTNKFKTKMHIKLFKKKKKGKTDEKQ